MDNERPIEQRLRAYGKSRQARAGGVSLHPATRRLLQGEVARTYRRAGTGALEPSASSRIWMRIAWTGAVLGTLIVLLLTVSPEKRAPSEMALLNPEAGLEQAGRITVPTAPLSADKESSSLRESGMQDAPAAMSLADTLTAAPPAPASGPVPPPLQPLAAKALKEQPTTSLFDSKPAAQDARLAATPQPSSKGLPQMVADFAETNSRSMGVGLVTAVRSTDASALGYGYARAEKASADDQNQRQESTWELAPAAVYYARTDSNEGPSMEVSATSNAGSQPMARRQISENRKLESSRETFMANQSYVRSASPLGDERLKVAEKPRLLSNFRVQQTASGFEVIDADGSVYKGHLEPLEEAKRAFERSEDPARAGAFSMAPVRSEQTLLFRVAGTNQSLRQHVFITGQLVPQAPPASTPGQSSLSFSNEQVQLGLSNNEVFSNQNALVLTNQLQLAPVFQNSFIEGKLRVGQEPEVEIRARPQNFPLQNQ